ncbi:glycosyltransferase [Nonlabens marinus]|uniref:Glycosyltransferase n=1 Tax=Nonlabens marinus S1-08 TaxID=1454201 RepID=W8W055_9FLAO|nr:glycosyltransferase [Nonlabens marinus]BAO55736.1 hypothetical protein NMS_1727 [Nonlabens marinus S1-08]
MDKQKTILFKLGQFPHLSETFIISQIKLAIDAGYNVKILVRQLMDVSILTDTVAVTNYDILSRIFIENYNIPNNKFKRVIIALWKAALAFIDLNLLIMHCRSFKSFSLAHIYQFSFYQQFTDIDIIHVQFGTNTRPVDILKQIGFLKGKLVISFHGHDAFFPINGVIPIDNYYDYAFANADFIIANTNYLKKALINIDCPEEKIKVINIPVDPIFFETPIQMRSNSRTLRIITIGRLHKIKGHALCIKAMKELKMKGVDVTLTIVGDGKEKESLLSSIQTEELINQVFLLGKKSQNQIIDLLDQHDVYITTSIPVEYGRRETQGIATIEAQARGLVVVAFDSGGIKYTLQDKVSGFLVKEGDVDQLVDKLIYLFQNKDQRLRMSSNAIKVAKDRFSQEVIQKQWINIYGGP